MAILHPSAQSPLPKIAPLLIAALQKAGWTVRTTHWGGRRADESIAEKVVVRSGELLLAVARLLQRRDAVLFVNSSHSWKGFARDLPLVLAARGMGHGTLLLWHGSEPDEIAGRPYAPFTVATALLVRSADAVLLLSGREMRLLSSALPHGRFFRVANPYLAKTSLPPRVPMDPPTILFVGRLIAAKGIFELLEAFAGLRASHDCRLTMVGDGPEAPAVRSWLEEHSLSSFVDMTGYLGEADLLRRYAEADVFVLPSYSEGFPTVVSEAMDAGLPLVTTDCGGMADHLEEGVHCLFVQAGDARGLEAAIRKLLVSPELRATMGAANRLRVRDFAPDAVIGDYVRAIEYVAGAVRARRGRARTT